MQTLTIGKLASMAAVGVETIRYYERRGLVTQPPRQGSGYRRYPKALVQRIQFIKMNQALGFSLKQIKAVLDLLDSQEMDCEHVGRLLDQKLKELEQKIEEYRNMQLLLHKLRENVGVCGGKGPMEILGEHLAAIQVK